MRLLAMGVLKSKLDVILAGVYALVSSVVLYFDFQSLDSDYWGWASLVLTLPWSMGIVFIGFLLIHISPYGMEYGFALCALLNAGILYLIGNLISRRHKQQSS
jgi:hypothetical protein